MQNLSYTIMGKTILLYNNICGIFLESTWQHFNWKIHLYQKLSEIITVENMQLGPSPLNFIQNNFIVCFKKLDVNTACWCMQPKKQI